MFYLLIRPDLSFFRFTYVCSHYFNLFIFTFYIYIYMSVNFLSFWCVSFNEFCNNKFMIAFCNFVIFSPDDADMARYVSRYKVY